MAIILFDIDETLLSDRRYPDNFNNIIKEIGLLKKQKCILGICTSRPFDSNVKKVAKDYCLNGPIITENGACIYDKKRSRYKINKNSAANINLNKLIKEIIANYFKKNKIIPIIKITGVFHDNKAILLNKFRKKSTTIRFPEKLKEHTDLVVEYLKSNLDMTKMKIEKWHNKLIVSFKNDNKINGIEKNFNNQKVFFITDYERNLPAHKDSIKLYSVGEDERFNNLCDEVYPTFGKGTEKILKKLRRKL